MIRPLSQEELDAVAGACVEAGFGALDTKRGCLPLVAMDVDARIEGLASHCRLQQTFRNGFDEPLEATYIFPLPPRAAVCGFRMTLDGAVVEGRIDERGRARADYDAAVAEGRSAAIAEEDRPDVFTIRVGNVPPRSPVRIELTLVGPLGIDALEATFRFPLVVAPRYCPGDVLDGAAVGPGVTPDTDLVPDASRISPPVLLPGFPDPVRLGFRIRVDGAVTGGTPAPGTGWSCSLPLEESIDGTDVLLSVKTGQRLDRDLVLRFPLPADDSATGTLFVEPDARREPGLGRAGGTGAAPGDASFSLVVLPPADSAAVRRPRDVVFALDRSGSMGGWQIVAARRAVARMIDTLSARDRVGLLAFDSSIQYPGDGPALGPATDRRRWELLEWLAGIDARGGTELAAALEAGLKIVGAPARKRRKRADAEAGRDTILVLVTDGQVADEERVLAGLVRRLGDTTLFVVGIATTLNEGLLSRLADSSGGSVECVESEDRLDAVMDRIQDRLVAPLVTGITVEGEGLDVVADGVLPAPARASLFPGVPLVLRGRLSDDPRSTVVVRGTRRDGGEWRAVARRAGGGAAGVGNLWARARLRYLEDRYAVDDCRDRGELERQIVELSTTFGVLCRFTALVAIDSRDPRADVAGVPMRRVVQPVAASWRHLRDPSADLMMGITSPDCAGLVSFATSRGPLGIDLALAQRWESDRGDDADVRDQCDDESMPLPRSLLSAVGFGGLRRMIRDLLALVRPRSANVGDIPAALVQMLLEEVAKVIGMLRLDSVPEEDIRRLAEAAAALSAAPSDLLLRRGVLDALHRFVPDGEPWWIERVCD